MISSMSWYVSVGQDDVVMDGHGDKVEGVCSIPILVPCELLSRVSSKLHHHLWVLTLSSHQRLIM